MMLTKCLAVVFLAGLAVAEVPSFIPVCGRRNPNLEKCMLDAANALRDRLKAGIPEIGLPPQDPRHVEKFTLADTDAIRAVAHNVTITGMGDFVAETMQDDIKAHQVHTVMRFKKLILEGEYDVNAKLIVPINGRGPIHVEADDVVTDIVMKYKLVKIKGANHIRYFSVTTSLTLKNWSAVFEPSATMDSTLVTAINAALEGSRQEMFEVLKPNVEKIVSELTMDISNKIMENFTYDELLPDRE